MDGNSIGAKIRNERLKRNWSQKYLGELIGSVDALCKYENGFIEPTRENSMKLAEIFNTGTKYFYDKYFEDTDTFKQIIEMLLKNSGLSKRKFANKLGVSNRTLLRWLNGDIPTKTTFNSLKISNWFIDN